jgi:hypothetical protein
MDENYFNFTGTALDVRLKRAQINYTLARNNLEFNCSLNMQYNRQYDFPYESASSLNKPYVDYVLEEIGIKFIISPPTFNRKLLL